MRIHLVTNIDNGKGLERDYRLLSRLLESWGHRVRGVHYLRPEPPGEADLVIFLEVYAPRLAEHAPRRWLVPNAEWWRAEDNPSLGDFELVLCKTRDGLMHFQPLTPRARYLGFLSEDHGDPGVPRARRFLHVAGGSNAKGTESVLAAWERHRIPYPLTVVSSLGWSRRPRNVEFVGRTDARWLRFLQNMARFHLCPSRYEGWGHGLHEGLSVGAAVVVPDTPAMAEIDGCALRMPAWPAGRQGLVRTHVVAPDDLRNAVEQCAAFTDSELRRIQQAARDAFLGESERFLATLWEVLDERPLRAAPAVDRRLDRGATTTARLALVFSCATSSAQLVRRSVLALRAQTADPASFTVLVACVDGDPDGAIHAAVEPDAHPFGVEIVERPSETARVPPLMWFLDAGVVLSPEAVERVLGEHDAALARGLPAVIATTRARVATTPGAPRSGAPAVENEIEIESVPVVWSGLVEGLVEGDARFAGVGAARAALLEGIQGVHRAGLIDARLLVSVQATYPPRERVDLDARLAEGPHGLRAQEIREGARTWRERLSAVRARLRSSVLDAAPSGPLPDCSPDAIEARTKLVRAVRAVAAPKLRGLYGGVVVVGEAAELIADDVLRVCGLATRVVCPAGLAALPANHACGVILSDVVARAAPDERERLLGHARRVVKATGPLVIVDLVIRARGSDATIGSEGPASDPDEIQISTEYVGVRAAPERLDPPALAYPRRQ
ncbi:MAG: glycosyltransferase [Byssovorax sp.]